MLSLLFVLLVETAPTATPKSVATWACDTPAFMLLENEQLFVTQFTGDPFVGGSIVSANVTGRPLTQQPTFATIDTNNLLLWPNQMTPTPSAPTTFVVGDGFLVPGKSTGSITQVSLNRTTGNFDVTKLTRDKADWFYHRVVWADVNADGLLDIVTARAYNSVLSGGRGELIWLEAPLWVEHHIVDGPDISFDLYFTSSASAAPFVVYAAEFFGKRFAAYSVAVGGVVTRTDVIDKSLGALYDVRVADLANVGSFNDLIVTNYQYSSPGSLFIYTGALAQPRSLVRRTIYDKFQNVQFAAGSGAPGFVFPHDVRVNAPRGTPRNILVSGDGSQAAYLFTPISVTNGTVVSYALAWSQQYASTVGYMVVADVDGNGRNDILISLYDLSQIAVFSY